MVELKTSKLFSSLLAEELQTLEQTCQFKAVPAGQIIFQEGDPADGVYIIVEGQVQILALVGQDQQRVLSKLSPGDFFGEMAVLDNAPRSATAKAETEVKLYRISCEDLLEILERSPRIALGLVREFSRRMREFDRQYVQEVIQTERLALVGRFARSIVHDFKNPLAIIGLAADLGSDVNATAQMRILARDRIRKQVDRLSDMINELLEFTRGEQASVVLALTDYAGFVMPLSEELRLEAADKNVALILETAPPKLQVLLDHRRLTHVFFNLVHNAIDVMPNGGLIKFRFTVQDRHVLTEVEDTGRGIDPQIAGRLFEPFATFGKSHGTGLGLSICKRIVEDHKGRIGVRSEPGRGATFWFTLPLPV